MTDTLQGSCLCGAVRFHAPAPSLWCAHCHCTMCQRAHGAAFVTWVGLPADRAVIEGGALAWYASSPGAERGFCSRCGSSLFFRSTRWPGELHVTRANFTGPVDRAPSAHVFHATHVDWFTATDALPRQPDAS